MKRLICLLIMLSAVPVFADDKTDAVLFAQTIVGEAYQVAPASVLVQVESKSVENTKVGWISWERRGAIWLSPSVLTWDSNAKPVWRVGAGTSYALGNNSSLVLHIYKNYNGDKKTRPQFGWVINF